MLIAVVVLGLPLALCVGAGRLRLGPYAEDFGVVVTQHEPTHAQVWAADPRYLNVGVVWSDDGYCSGQFTVAVTETPDEIRIGTVTSRLRSGGSCAGLGSVGGKAWTSVVLDRPIANRVIVRDADGARLPVYDDTWQLVVPSPTA